MNIIFFDTETTGLDHFQDKITLMQIKPGRGVRIVRNFSETKINEIKELLENNLIVGHNLKFDLKFLKQQFNIEPTHLFDTYIAEILISGGMKARQKGVATLDTVTKERINIELNKDVKLRLSFKGQELTTEQIKYAMMDVAVLPEIHKQQQSEITKLGLQRTFDIEMSALPAVVWLELSGLPLDLEALKKKEVEVKEKIIEAKTKIITILKESGFKSRYMSGYMDINIDSPKQLLEALQKIGLKVESTGDEVISALEHRIGKAIKEYRKLNKLLTGFILKYPEHIHAVTGRIQPEFNQCGTNTGRFTSSKPNMQQVPQDKSIRALFKAPPGYKIITADYSQIELRIIAEVSQEPKFLDIYKNNGDLHRLTASLILNKPASEITKEERQQAKAVNFGFAYGLGAESFKDKAKGDYDLDISMQQAQDFRNKFFGGYPVLNKYLRNIGNKAAAEEHIVNLSGRRVSFPPDLEGWQYENMGRNTPIQSLSADITKSAMGRLYLKLRRFQGLKFINSVHDELVFEVKEDDVKEVSGLIKTIMEEAGQEFLKTVPCIVEVVVGDSWQK